MNCPKCAVSLVRKRFKERPTDVDFCQKCHGIWFDDGELSSILRVPARHLAPPANPRPSALLCPRCEKQLLLFPYPGTLTIIDGCGTCRGVWLDGGEYQELAKIRSVSPRPEPQPARRAVESETVGVKAQLIRFVDRSIESLWAGIRG
ncbi:MAG TPA: zf-TFIIB domain-containing protein [Thermoanaerobaculia bacterium]|nr:zf-TFIIB domain-containing protein [Thermoanaerobaculia bacterium]